MKYWDQVLKFHESISKDSSSGEGLRAVHFLKHFFEKLGCAGFPRDHPLDNRLKLVVGAEEKYQWLIQYAKKLHTASLLSGFEEIATRLTKQSTFLDANNEIEVTLKFHLAGLDVSFVPTDTHKTPDILLKINKKEYHVEVSSLNPPDQEALIWTLHDQLLPLTFLGLVSGGLIDRIPNKNKLVEIMDQVKEKTKQIKETKESVKLSFPGYATIYIAPRDKISEIPEGCRGMYTFAHSPRQPIEVKIRRKIIKKHVQLFSSGKPVILFLYTQTIDNEMLYEYFKKVAENIEVILASYPILLGLVLTVPHRGMEVVSSLSLDSLKRESKKNKVFLESEVGKNQYESSIIWQNLHADQAFPLEILSAIENISSNSNKLLQLPSY